MKGERLRVERGNGWQTEKEKFCLSRLWARACPFIAITTPSALRTPELCKVHPGVAVIVIVIESAKEKEEILPSSHLWTPHTNSPFLFEYGEKREPLIKEGDSRDKIKEL